MAKMPGAGAASMIEVAVAEGPVQRRAMREPFARRLARWAALSLRTRVVTARAHPPLVSFTFDDIPASAAEVGASILEQAGRRGTFYISGGIGETVEPNRRYATAAHYLELHRAGHEIGCHTFSHRAVSSLDHGALAQDLDRNAAYFAGLDPSIALTSFAYPYNHTSLRAKRQIERRFSCCRGGVPGINAGRIDLGFLRAVELNADPPDPVSARRWIRRAVAERGWLIFFMHGVGDDPEPWCCPPALLRETIGEALAQDAVVVPIREALSFAVGPSLFHRVPP